MNNQFNTLILLLFFSSSLVSCDFILEEKIDDVEANESIATDKLEAGLILEATQQNLNAIALCQAIEKSNSNNEIGLAAKQIREEQEAIFESLQEIAITNLILVPNSPDTNVNTELLNMNDVIEREVFISQIQENLNVQKAVFDSLILGTDDEQILLSARENIKKLKSNIEISETTLESLK